MTDEARGTAPEATELRRSSRDHTAVRTGLAAWLAGRLPDGAAPEILALEATSANGMSSETLLVDAAWSTDGHRDVHRLVWRLAPDSADIPVFERYDLGRQFETIRLVAELTDVPVPSTLWSEPDPAVIGSPFFVMGRVDGRVPPDVMPYNFGDSWLHDATPAEQRHLQDATVDVLARLHAIDAAPERFAFLAPAGGQEVAEAGASTLRGCVAATRSWYEFAAADGFHSPLVERTFAWLDAHWPRREGAPVLCWGDSRIGNVMYDGFDPVAVLDWEMATLGPRELDVAWLIYGHRMFEDIAATFDLPGMPTFLRADDVAATYESLTGHAPRDLAWFGTYAALQYAIVFLRTGARAVHFGETAMPDEVDDLVMNREPLERMLAGTYWS
ncbi:MAG TPA: phosphotransferase family protein [Acidimicrobiales bacterium]|nr:phosphotransferase family protein [Acidimicrobiales bacterium]